MANDFGPGYLHSYGADLTLFQSYLCFLFAQELTTRAEYVRTRFILEKDLATLFENHPSVATRCT